jgi:hypothetical protein
MCMSSEKLAAREESEEDAFWHRFVFTEEDRIVNGTVYRGGYRWFRSPNIIPIERYRRKRNRLRSA